LALSGLLRRDGVELLQARSGREVLELLLVHDVALAIIDVQMPGMDGFELVELTRSTQRTRHVPMVFLTAGAHDNQRRFRGYEAGAVNFLYKPIEQEILRSKADIFLELYRQRQEIDFAPLPKDQGMLLFQSVRELLMNVLKYRNRNQARITVTQAEGSLHITVADQGAGFDLDAAATARPVPGFWFFNIRERIIALGGRSSRARVQARAPKRH